jgi:hypothetical protein
MAVAATSADTLVIEEVISLEVEEALTNVAAHIGLITVETQPLATAFLLFRRRQTAESQLSCRCSCRRLQGGGSSPTRGGVGHQPRGHGQPRAHRRPSATLLLRRGQEGCRATLVCSSVVHGRLKVGRVVHLDVDLDVLARIEVASMAENGIIAVLILLD